MLGLVAMGFLKVLTEKVLLSKGTFCLKASEACGNSSYTTSLTHILNVFQKIVVTEVYGAWHKEPYSADLTSLNTPA